MRPRAGERPLAHAKREHLDFEGDGGWLDATAGLAAVVSERMSLRRLLQRITLAAAVVAFASNSVLASEAQVSVSTIRLKIPGGAIRAEVFEPKGEEKRPTVLVLHGAGGTLLDGPEMRRVARHLAARGCAAYLVRYFERTGTLFALDGTMQRHFPAWLETVRASIIAVQNARGDAAPVGLYGYSLGGFLALSAASDNPRVGAVVEHAGGVWNSRMNLIGRMPPVLMVHGQRDGRVSFEKYASPLMPVLRARAPTLATRFFPDEGHVFTAPAMKEVREAAAEFFLRRLTSG